MEHEQKESIDEIASNLLDHNNEVCYKERLPNLGE